MKSSTVIPTAPQSDIFSTIESPTIQAEIIFPTEAVLLPTGMPEVETEEINWTRIITYFIETPCGYFVLPSNLVNEENPASWIQDNFSYLLDNQESYLFSADPGLSGTFSLVLNLTNITNEQFWVNIDNDLPVKVHYADELQQDASTYRQGGCGGGGFIRYFSVVPLKSDFIEYDILSSSTDADYFTLEPGESEMFSLSFTCQSPGIYGLKISIPITYKQTDGIIDIPIINGVVCPERISTYEVDSLGEGWFVYDSAVYYWDGSEYIKE
jgi:hypothetical protein